MNHLHKSYFFLTLLFTCFISQKGIGQEVTYFEDFEISHFTSKEGLPQNSIQSITQDAKGFIWFTTYFHLIRWDGYNFKTYKISESSAIPAWGGILADSRNYIWITTQSNGLLLFKPDKEEFIHFPYDPDDPNSLSNFAIRSLAEDQWGNIWAGTWNGLNRLSLKKGFEENPDSISIRRYYTEKYAKSLREHFKKQILPKKPYAGISQVKNNERRQISFTVDRPTQFFLYSSGQWNPYGSRWADRGWISRESGEIVWEINNEKAKSAGSSSIFLEEIDLIDLDIGEYQLHYQTNSRYAYEDWPGLAGPPDFPEAWGIQIWEINKAESQIIQSLSEKNPVPSISNNVIRDLFSDSNGHIWVVTAEGIDLFASEEIEDVSTVDLSSSNEEAGYQNRYVNQKILVEQGMDLLIIGKQFKDRSSPTLCTVKFNKESKTYYEKSNISSDAPINQFYFQNSTIIDHRGNAWFGLGPENPGLFWKKNILAKGADGIKAFSPGLFSRIQINDIYVDREGIIWTATESGLFKLQQENNRLNQFPIPDNENKVGFSNISLIEDANNNIWIGGYGRVLRFNLEWDTIDKIIECPYGSGEPIIPIVDADSILWILCSGSGLCRWDAKQDNFVKVIDADTSNIGLGWIYGLTPDSLFIFADDYGIAGDVDRSYYLFNKENLSFKPIKFDTLPDENWITHFYFESKNTVWTWDVNFPGGILKFKYNREGDFELLDTHFRGKFISSFLTNEEGRHFASVLVDTLLSFDPLTRLSSQIANDHLVNNSIFKLFSDSSNKLWLLTSKGIIIFDINRKEFFLPEKLKEYVGNLNFIFQQSSLKSKSGKFFFGDRKSLYSFHPDSIKLNPIVPKIALTKLKIGNQTVELGDNVLSNTITYSNHIRLKHDQNDLAIEYAGMLFNNPEGIKYQYYLEPYDRQWVDAGNERIARYTNLPPNTYTLKIKAANSDGVWSEEETYLTFTISPPWYWNAWSIGIYVFAIISLLYALFRWRTNNQRKKLLEASLLNERLQQVNKLKDQFLANTSHELRTPIQGIIGLSEAIQDRSENPQDQEDLSMIISSSIRLSSLINDILDFSKLKNYDIELLRKPIHLHVLADIVLRNNAPLLKGKELELINAIPKDLPAIDGDENRLQQVLYNLIGNAVKFTEIGKIVVGADYNLQDSVEGISNNEQETSNDEVIAGIEDQKSEEIVMVWVKDTGIGIPENKREAIFQEFEQGDGTISREFAGTGLGLSISKKLVELHGGKMWVESEERKGSIFYFTLPTVDGKRLTVDDKRKMKDKSGELGQSTTLNPMTPSIIYSGTSIVAPAPSIVNHPQSTVRILVVDDEPINQQVFKNHLQGHNFQLVQAMHGEEALNLIENNPKFDLVLLDVMMPRMSGYEVCQKIREKYLPSELPVIMITAKNQLQDIVQGLSLGANDYLPKPFHKEELLARIKTQIDLHHIFQVAGRFVPYEFLHSLNRERITEVTLGNYSEHEVSVLFTDIRDYTSLAETMTPEENFKFVSAFHRRMGPIIQENGGFINQYLGDAIMAIFLEGPEKALKAAIEMQHRLATYNKERIANGRQSIQMGIGLHSGPLIMGIIGDQNRMDAATIADTVNTASRIEGLTKYYGANILLSQDSLSNMQDSSNFHLRYLGQVQVKGKKEPLGLYECFDGDSSNSILLKKESSESFKKGLQQFFKREFPEATSTFNEVLKLNKADQTARLFMNKSSEYLLKGVADDWTGIEVMTFK